MKIVMAEQASRCYFLCDTSKHGHIFPYLITDLDRVNEMIDET